MHYHILLTKMFYCPVSWGCRIHWLHLCRGVRPHLTSILDMTLNNLMVRFQQCWSFGECGVPLHCHRAQCNILTWPAGVNTADVVDRSIDKTGVITKKSSCPQVLCIRGCWQNYICSRIISTRWLPKCHHAHSCYVENRCIRSKISENHLNGGRGWIRW